MYNGVSVAWLDQLLIPDSVLSCEASPRAIGAYYTNHAYLVVRIPKQWKFVNIAYLEMWAVILNLRAWGE